MKSSNVRRVLIYRLGSLGDTVVAVPALRVVEQAFPEAERILLTNKPTHSNAPAAFAVLQGSGLVHGYMDYPWRTRSVRDLARLWWRVLRFRPQVLVYMQRSRGPRSVQRDAAFFRLCGIRHIVGLPFGDLDTPHYDEKTGLWEQEGARLLRQVGELGTVDVNDLRNWDLRLTEAEQQKADQELTTISGHPIIACGPGTKMQAKDWDREKWRALLGVLRRRLPDHALVLVGAKEDLEAAHYVAASWNGPVLNLCGKLTPRETAAVLRHSVLFLGPDSGPMHLAAAYGVPCTIAFAAIDRPGRWFPIGDRHRPIYHHVDCENCHLTVCIEQRRKCLTSITVDEMLAAALGAWQPGQRLPPSQTPNPSVPAPR